MWIKYDIGDCMILINKRETNWNDKRKWLGFEAQEEYLY